MNIETVIQDIIWTNVYYQREPDYFKLSESLRSLGLEESDIWQILQDIRNGEY